MADIKSLFLDHIAQVVGSPSALVIDRAEGNYLYDSEGKEYLDFISGISVANLGHGHPTVVLFAFRIVQVIAFCAINH